MIRMLIRVGLNRDLQGDPVYIRCARCGTTAGETEGGQLGAVTSPPARVTADATPDHGVQGARAGSLGRPPESPGQPCARGAVMFSAL